MTSYKCTMILKCSCISLDHCKCLILINSNCGKGRKFPPIEQKFTYDQRNIRICKSASIDHKEMEKIKKGMKEKSKRINVMHDKVLSTHKLTAPIIMLVLRILTLKLLHTFSQKMKSLNLQKILKHLSWLKILCHHR